MHFTIKGCGEKSSNRSVEGSFVYVGIVLRFVSLGLLLWSIPVFGQQASSPAGIATVQQVGIPQASGSISGRVLDPTGAAVAGASVKLKPQGVSAESEVRTASDGQFSFLNVTPGPYQITITADGFTTQTLSGTLPPVNDYVAPPITLALASENTEVRVNLPKIEVAEEEVKEEEKQRVLGFIPNFYVSYDAKPVPLTSKQKFELAWRTSIDPFTFLLTGVFAGLQQSQGDFDGFGQGAAGYGKRYGASYGVAVTSTFIGGAILPSVLKQDPRYFYKGTGSTRSRIGYAIANAVICKGDNGHWQPNYSNVLGGMAAGGLSNLYYPRTNRSGAELTFEDALIGIGASAAANLLQEFFIRKFTPSASARNPANP